MNDLQNKHILLGVTGGIAAYKSAELIRRLQDQGAQVRVVMTRAATEFITPLTLQALSGFPVSLDLLDTETESVMGHIELARWADLVLVAPASANFMSSLRQGRGDDLLTTLCLAATCPIAVAPAMNQAMWGNIATQENCTALRKNGIIFFGPDAGLQACGEIGEGRLLDVPDIVKLTCNVFPSGLLTGKTVMITAGPTREAIDPVRYISNHSSGKQGYALAEAAIEAGAKVILISGPVSLAPPSRATVVQVISADDMYAAVMTQIDVCDVFIGVAAVADFKPALTAQQKMKKTDTNATQAQTMTLTLIENPDIISSVAHLSNPPFTVGFAAETENMLEYASDKLNKKRLNLIVANNVADAEIGFNSDNNSATIISQTGTTTLAVMSKRQMAVHVIESIKQHMDAMPTIPRKPPA
ncbi:MAG: phosphopantothenoylcysteine decarboxylase/phosphopantothenate--cysteine ligase [Candidatus Pseudothioglobus sp.]|jgi:phosphopantothenoylcysteine decarboxylase/phosphopantothenate--cysteine ligase